MYLILNFRQLKKDYDDRVFGGFVFSMWLLPAVLLEKEDALGQEDFNLDPEEMKDKMEVMMAKIMDAWTRSPQIHKVVGGNLMEMVERGLLKLQI